MMEHQSEGRPRRIKNRVADVAAALLGWQVARYIDKTNITEGDQPILSHEPRRLFVQMASSGIGNLGWRGSLPPASCCVPAVLYPAIARTCGNTAEPIFSPVEKR